MEVIEDFLWKESFFKDNFNVDKCLSRYTLKSDLEILRRDLKNYGNDLHKQMSDILKTETEAIVNLAEHLTNLNSKIENLSLPVNQLREEIKLAYDVIKNVQSDYLSILQAVKNNNMKRYHFNLKYGIISSVDYIQGMIENNYDELVKDSVILERAVSKFSFERNYLDASGVAVNEKDVIFVSEKLIDLINQTFIAAIRSCDCDALLRCLKMYDNLGEQYEAEKVYQIEILRPEIRLLFTEAHLEECNQDIDQIYLEALDVFDEKIQIFNQVLKSFVGQELKSFNFALNSFWIEIDKQLCEGLPHLTAPGNPELFQKRFNSTWHFLTEIAKRCGDEKLIWANRSFQTHIKRFNLPVYFEIRFQQISGKFEKDAVAKSRFSTNSTVQSNDIKSFCCKDNCVHINFKLKLTFSLWEALIQCFNSEVFIESLSDQFLKLSMLLLSRYLSCFEYVLMDDTDVNWDDFIFMTMSDFKLITNLIGDHNSDVDKTVYTIIPHQIKPHLKTIFDINKNRISAVGTDLNNRFISNKSKESLFHLQCVEAIPRLYRRTNRNAPKLPSNYMTEAIKPILSFCSKFESNNEITFIIEEVITNVTKSYLKMVLDVLKSVCKTEESLRRLKSRSVGGEETASRLTENTSDEVKIREQIKVDAWYFTENLKPLVTVDGQASQCLNQLKRQTSE